MHRFLAFDLGAESGRAILGTLADGALVLEELHRFPNQPVRVPNGLYWDTFRLFHEIREGLSIAAKRGLPIDGIGIDTWGVDFGLLDATGSLIDNPRHYRDARTTGVPDQTFAIVPRAEVFETTGVQFLQFNSLYQWHAMGLADAPALKVASRLLFMPDLLSYWLTGEQAVERTIASTSQFYDPRAGGFASSMLKKLGLDPGILPSITEPGSRLGVLLPEIAASTGLGAVPVFATASHDTAAAVAAVPAAHDRDDWCYISSGTWSLMGVEVDHPIITPECLAANFTNEVGAGGKIRLLKNIAGLWLLQECRRTWGRYSYEELAAMAESAHPMFARLDPDRFLEAGNMPTRIADYCRETGQAAPETPGQITRVILESLAFRYKEVLERLERLSGRSIRTIHVVGGGSRNALLNRLTAEITGREVIAGPAEATAAGNILVQAMGAGVVRDLAEARRIVRASNL